MPEHRALDVNGVQLSAKLRLGVSQNSFKLGRRKQYQIEEDHRMRLLCLCAVLVAGLTGPLAIAATPALVFLAGSATRQFTIDELLARRDAVTLAVPHDPAYGRAMSY